MKDNDKQTSRMMIRKHKKRRHFFRRFILILAVLIAAGTTVAAFEMHRLNPLNHFNNLKTVGGDPSEVKQKAGAFNVLLIGNDERKKNSTASHTDSMVLIHVNLNKHTYNLLSIPRDTRVNIGGGVYTKLTSVQYVSQLKNGTKQGIIDAVQAVSRLTGVPINYYAETNYWGLKDMVDSIGGIDMKLPFRVRLTHPWDKSFSGKVYEVGTHHFDGKTATEVVHERYSLPGTDYGRQQLQEAALMAIAKKVMQPANITKLPALSRALPQFLTATNMSSEDMLSAALGAKGNFHPEKQIKYRQVKGTNARMYDDVLKSYNDQLILPKEELNVVIEKYFSD
ncbi:MAG: LCP family protein [Sporolactobacillus sp.]|jgi:LCP family protein required for cell wall assembly|nr:LCP family protein [Sporolactobacillus sp.]